MNRKIIIVLALLPLFFLASCGKDDDNKTDKLQGEVIENYANIVLQNYQDARADANRLKIAIDDFVANPSADKFENCKKVWIDARESYGPSEAYRFANGPIDDEDGPEGLLNSWPLDENYIDYVQGDENAGIINNIETYPEITKQLLEELNQPVNGEGETSEENVSTGYHAIEFLLWGQDLTAPSENKPGNRQYTDYTTAKNADRRGAYLKVCAELLIDHLDFLIDDWKEGGAYRKTFLAMDKKQALSNMISGIAILSKAELAGERMYVALESQSQEDEHSCFSDNTHRDIRLNLDGIINVYKGEYGSIKGASIEQLVKEQSTEAAAKVEVVIRDTKAKVYATKEPFDIAITSGAESEDGKVVLEAVKALQKLGDEFVAAAKVIGVSASSEEEE